jgi:hypothetical protein
MVEIDTILGFGGTGGEGGSCSAGSCSADSETGTASGAGAAAITPRSATSSSSFASAVGESRCSEVSTLPTGMGIAEAIAYCGAFTVRGVFPGRRPADIPLG